MDTRGPLTRVVVKLLPNDNVSHYIFSLTPMIPHPLGPGYSPCLRYVLPTHLPIDLLPVQAAQASM